MRIVRDVPASEAERFCQLLALHGLDPAEFSFREEQFEFDFGAGATLVVVTGPTCATYSRFDGDWLGQLEAHLLAGLYEPGG